MKELLYLFLFFMTACGGGSREKAKPTLTQDSDSISVEGEARAMTVPRRDGQVLTSDLTLDPTLLSSTLAAKIGFAFNSEGSVKLSFIRLRTKTVCSGTENPTVGWFLIDKQSKKLVYENISTLEEYKLEPYTDYILQARSYASGCSEFSASIYGWLGLEGFKKPYQSVTCSFGDSKNIFKMKLHNYPVTVYEENDVVLDQTTVCGNESYGPRSEFKNSYDGDKVTHSWKAHQVSGEIYRATLEFVNAYSQGELSCSVNGVTFRATTLKNCSVSLSSAERVSQD